MLTDRNNFDLLRLLFAATVALVHIYVLTGSPPSLSWIPAFLSADVAVKAFFVISGFLIFMSYENSSSLRSYALKRVRRIYPAYFTVVALCAVGLAAVSALPVTKYFSLRLLKYSMANFAFLNFLQPTIPGVFEQNPLPEINGALWTLKLEVLFYATVPVLVSLMRRIGRLPVLVTAYLGSVLYSIILTAAAARTDRPLYADLAKQLPGQLSYFVAGASFFYFSSALRPRLPYLALASVGALLLAHWYDLPLLTPLALATLIIFFATTHYLGNFARYGDFSYGVYIIHVPIIQLLFSAGMPPRGVLVAAPALTAIGAVLMWHLVEKRFLTSSNHYRGSSPSRAHQQLDPSSGSKASSNATY